MGRPSGTAAELEARRRRAVRMVQNGATQRLVAARLGVSQSAVSRWMTQFHEGGVSSLKARPTPGRPSSLSDNQMQRLAGMLRKRPAQLGFDAGRWTLPLIRDLIGKRFRIWYHQDHLSRLTRELRVS